MPSPQMPAMLHTLGEPEQLQPAGTWQIALHPSPGVLLLSSQASPGSSTPLPHRVGLTLMPSIGGRASNTSPVPPLPVLPPLPPFVVAPGLTPAQPKMTLVVNAAAIRARERN